jgi:large subunit ribosomal protein L15
MNLSQLRPPAGQKQKKQRIGQGMGTRRGKYSGRGAKGQKSISGYSKMRGFEGGQMPLHRRMPKRGFNNPFREEYAVLNLNRLDKLEGDQFSPESLIESGVLKKLGKGLKILANGEVTRKLTVKAHVFSEAAKQKIEAAGGSVEVIPPFVPAPIKNPKKEAAAKRKASKPKKQATS